MYVYVVSIVLSCPKAAAVDRRRWDFLLCESLFDSPIVKVGVSLCTAAVLVVDTVRYVM